MLHILISLLGLANKTADIPITPEYSSGESPIYQVQYRPSASHDLWGIAISSRAIHWLTHDLLTVRKAYAYHTIDLSEVRHCTMAYSRSIIATIVGGLLFLSGAMGVIVLISAKEPIPWFNLLVSVLLAIVGLVIAVIFKGQPYLRLVTTTRLYTWQPPFAFDGANRRQVKTIFADVKQALTTVNVAVMDQTTNDEAGR